MTTWQGRDFDLLRAWSWALVFYCCPVSAIHLIHRCDQLCFGMLGQVCMASLSWAFHMKISPIYLQHRQKESTNLTTMHAQIILLHYILPAFDFGRKLVGVWRTPILFKVGSPQGI